MSRLPVRGIGKSWRGKTCAYCTALAQGVDHIFAREFFPVERREGLPQVPACDICNNAKSRLETKLGCTMPLGAKHADAAALSQLLPERLANNQRVQRETKIHHVVRISKDNPFAVELTSSFDFDGDGLMSLLEFVVTGLFAHHWQTKLASDYLARAIALDQQRAEIPLGLLALNGERITNDVGDGAFVYEGLRAPDNPNTSLWRFSVFGGLTMVGDNNDHNRPLDELIVMTARREFWDSVAA